MGQPQTIDAVATTATTGTTGFQRVPIPPAAPPLAKPAGRIAINSQAFRYGEYDETATQTRNLRLAAAPLQFVINTVCDEALKGKELEIAVEIRDRETGQTLFETFWVTTAIHLKQQSAFIFHDLPPELLNLQAGQTYSYYASVLVTETDEFAERITRAIVR